MIKAVPYLKVIKNFTTVFRAPRGGGGGAGLSCLEFCFTLDFLYVAADNLSTTLQSRGGGGMKLIFGDNRCMQPHEIIWLIMLSCVTL